MYRVRESWTDARLDDFAKHVDHRFDEVDRRIGEADQKTERRFDKVDHELHRLNDRFDSLYRGLYQVGGGIIAALIGVIVTQL